MKTALTLLVGSALLLGGTFLCQAAPGPRGPARPGCDDASPFRPFPAELARILELNDSQQAQIKAILDEEGDKGLAQHEKQSELRRKLHLAEQAALFDEQAVRSIATALAGVEAERIVSRAKTQNRIKGVLTPAQRSLAARLVPEREERPAPPCGADHEGRRRQGPAADQEWR
jgi:Spy/CpxP family protein refolding chaperone